MARAKITPPTVVVGSVWQEDVDYTTRFVKVSGLGTKKSAKTGEDEPCAVVMPCNANGVIHHAMQTTTIALRRFGRAGGFKRPGECRPRRG